MMIMVFSCEGIKTTDAANAPSTSYIIESEELLTLLEEPSIKILDFRSIELYNVSHIANAIHITRKDIEDPSYPYSGVMPGRAQIENLFSSLGIKSTDTLVVYDDKGMCEAARLWWILQNYNFKNVRLLNGGFESWQALHGTISRERPVVTATNFKLPAHPEMDLYISKEGVKNALENDVIVIDTRSLDEFSGRSLKAGASIAGHIPGSIRVDWADNIDFHGDQRLKSKDDIAKNYAHINLNKSDLIIVYCHSGVRSAHTTFVLTQILGYENVKNYDGSWVEWSYYEDSTVEIETL
jgi:thiosulfate/3-mercaptopyruvate sulfurtransferase